jgi:hypothetical protein
VKWYVFQESMLYFGIKFCGWGYVYLLHVGITCYIYIASCMFMLHHYMFTLNVDVAHLHCMFHVNVACCMLYIDIDLARYMSNMACCISTLNIACCISIASYCVTSSQCALCVFCYVIWCKLTYVSFYNSTLHIACCMLHVESWQCMLMLMLHVASWCWLLGLHVVVLNYTLHIAWCCCFKWMVNHACYLLTLDVAYYLLHVDIACCLLTLYVACCMLTFNIPCCIFMLHLSYCIWHVSCWHGILYIAWYILMLFLVTCWMLQDWRWKLHIKC